MKDEILTHLNDPRQLEKLYRTNKIAFRRAFNNLYPELKGNPLADFWNERLHYETDEIQWGTRRELIFIVIAAVLAGIIAKLPAFVPVSEDFFYPRNIGFIIFPFLTAYFAWKNKVAASKIAMIAGLTIAGLIFINALPDNKNSNTLILSCIHLLLVLWSLSGFAFVGGVENISEKRLAYLQYNGDLVVMTALIMLAAGILTGVTIGLFELIGFKIKDFYFEYIVIFGLPAAPIIGTYLTQTNPQLVGKVSPVIAKIFSPLVLIMLVVYLAAMVYSGKDPYNDREFLLVFNALLVGVMAIIFFSVAESSKTAKTVMEVWILLFLSVVTVIVNGVALSAILFRISEWGITPNRAAVLGGNLLILINLLLVVRKLVRAVSRKSNVAEIGKAITFYLPVYVVWAIIVTFVFPFLFGFK